MNKNLMMMQNILSIFNICLSFHLFAPNAAAQCHLKLMGDVNGDGKMDIVGFGQSRVSVSLGQATGRFATPLTGFNHFTPEAEGWNTTHLRYLADVNGDNRADIVGFGNERVYVALGRADGLFGSLIATVQDFTAAQGWNSTEQLRLLADVNGDRRADIVGFGKSQVLVSLGQADGQFAAPLTGASYHFHTNHGWTLTHHLRYLADVNGDGRADIVGFGNEKVYVALGQTTGRFSETIETLAQFTKAQTWSNTSHPRYMADVNGDGKSDIVGFGQDRVYTALGQSTGRFGAMTAASPNFTIGGEGWETHKHIRQLADVNGDGKMDIVGFGNDKVYTALGQATGQFGALTEANGDFTIGQGWRVNEHLRFLGDVNGDGKADITGFGAVSVWVGLGQTTGRFTAIPGLNHFTPTYGGWITCPEQQPQIQTELRGWVDMHTHPMSHLGFGGKLIHGAPDVDILVPAKSNCRQYERAANIGEALGACNGTHGGHGVFDNPCGDHFRKEILRGTESKLHAQSVHREEGAVGYPALNGWPAHNDITHQQMWIDWVKRTYDNGLRIMVALTVNNVTLAAAVSGPGDRNPDDVSSSNIQIDEMKRMVARHNGSAGSVDNWMEIAYTAADIRRIVNSNRLAIILGMEVDNIGNFHKNNSVDPNNLTPLSTQLMRNEIQRIHNQGVRYIFPIHLVDNKLGGTAVYEDGFNMSNYHQTGRFWDIGCASPSDGIDKKFVVSGFDIALAVAKAKIGMDIARNPPTPPACGAQGHVNNLGLTALGEYAIKEMMKLGMIVDIDHMSKKSMDKTLEIATLANYPVNSGHNGIRGTTGSERSLNLTQARRMMTLGGLIGVGSSHATAVEFERNYSSMLSQLGGNARLAIGTDINGFEMPPAPRSGANVQYTASFPMCRTGSQSWDYNRVGVAHYGLMPDFFKDVNSIGSGRIFDNHLMKSAEYFAQMWEKCERQRTNVR